MECVILVFSCRRDLLVFVPFFFQDVIKVARQLENTVLPVNGLGLHSSVIKIADHGFGWLLNRSFDSHLFVLLPLHPDTCAPLHEERITAIREEPSLHSVFYNTLMKERI